MIKDDEIKKGCIDKAFNWEMVFTLLARDPAAPFAIRCWIGERLRLGLNTPLDDQITEAIQCAEFMEEQRDKVKEAKRRLKFHGEQIETIAENAARMLNIKIGDLDGDHEKT